MLSALWDTRGYFFWLALISLLCFALERLVPWRTEQKPLRAQIGQDFFWLFFNGHYAGILVATAAAWALGHVENTLGGWPWPSPMDSTRETRARRPGRNPPGTNTQAVAEPSTLSRPL